MPSGAAHGIIGRVVTVPDLVPPGDVAAAAAWRERRRRYRAAAPGGLPVTMALVTDGADVSTAAVLRDAGADVVGLLGPEPLESLTWAAEAAVPRAYPELLALLSDQVEAVCVELSPPASDVVARQATRAGLHVLLARPHTADSEAVRDVADAAEEGNLAHVVALDGRAWPAARHAQESSLGMLRQVTILGAPGDETGRVEITDLAGRLAGEVVAVCADPAAMPAPRLAPDAPVTLALLAASGATVLVNETPDGRLDTARITLAGSAARVVVEGRTVRRQDAAGVRELSLPAGLSRRPGLVEATGAVVRVVAERHAGVPREATFHDLLSATRILHAAATSRSGAGWVEL
jgi:Oxidoreductase family, NAD-binding Rossmann fold